MPSQLTYKKANLRPRKRSENTAILGPLFSGKEKDSETGYYYFGARYYNPDLSLWLSVDPMADKYPSLSPYNYCAWNPMKLVDPDGDSVRVIGSQSALVPERLCTDNLSVTLDEKSGFLNANLKNGDISMLTKEESLIYNAIVSTTIKTTIMAEKSYTKDGHNYFIVTNSQKGTVNFYDTPYGGSFIGTELSANMSSVKTYGFMDIPLMESLGYDQGVPHEISEQYNAGQISLNKKINMGPALQGKPNTNMQNAHNSAIPEKVQSGEMFIFGRNRNKIKRP